MIERLTVIGVTCVALMAPRQAATQQIDTVARRELAPGVSYRKLIDRSGPLRMNLVTMDLRRADLELRVARARDRLRGREKVTDMVRRASTADAPVLAALNGDFFDLESGENENNQVIAGEWWKGLKVTDSPYDTYDNVHVQFALDAERRPAIDRFILYANFL